LWSEFENRFKKLKSSSLFTAILRGTTKIKEPGGISLGVLKF
jgi:hypothetical protein